jgi:hypothetical protein
VLKWFSPQGWSHLVLPYGDNNVAVLLLSLAFTGAALALAYRLRARRDLGHGLIHERPGPAGSQRLRGALNLAWRQQRGLLGGWIAGYAIAGLVLGALATSIDEVARQGAAVEEFFLRYTASPEAGMTDAYLWLIALSLGYVSALYPLLALQAKPVPRGGDLQIRPGGAVDENDVALGAAHDGVVHARGAEQGRVGRGIGELPVGVEGPVAHEQGDLTVAARQRQRVLFSVADDARAGQSPPDLGSGGVHAVVVVPQRGGPLPHGKA